MAIGTPHFVFWIVVPKNLKKVQKNATVDYQALTKKVQKKCKKNAQIFGQFKKKQYLCTRFWETGVFLFSAERVLKLSLKSKRS